jgi:hypothetical protein
MLSGHPSAHAQLDDLIHLQSWESLNLTHQEQVLGLTVSPQQIEYAGTIERSIARCRADYDGNNQGVAIFAVDEENIAARRSYAKSGWLDTGVREQGRIGWVRYMNRELADS